MTCTWCGQQAGLGHECMITVGTCSICLGPVVTPKVVMAGYPVERRCRSCGALAREPLHGPIIEMLTPPKRSTGQ